jgi:hypothetical protein
MKKDRKSKQQKQAHAARPKGLGISETGQKVIAAGVVVLIIGYLVLTRTDPAGQNWASVLSPFLILGGYLMIGVGILFPSVRAESPVVQVQNPDSPGVARDRKA